MTIDGDSGEIIVTGVVDEAHLYGSKLRLTTTLSTKVGEPSVTVADEVTNISGQPGDMELLYHINFGVPLVGKGATVALPAKRSRRATRWRWPTFRRGIPTVPNRPA